MATHGSGSSMPFIPPEVLLHIIARLDIASMSYAELALVWVNLRSVSRLFRTEVEGLFQKEVLPKITLFFGFSVYPAVELNRYAHRELGWNYDDPDAALYPTKPLLFSFDRVGQDSTVTVFKQPWSVINSTADDYAEARKRHLRGIYRELGSHFRDYQEREATHACIVQVSGTHNDIVISDLRFSMEEDEICFNWKTHLNKLFSEETLVIKMSNAYGHEEATHSALIAKRPTQEIVVANAESERIEDNVWGVRPREVDVRSMLRSRRFHTWYRRHWQDILNQTIAVRPLGITDIPEEILAIDTIRYHSGFRNQAMHSDKYREFYRKRNNLASGDGHRDDDDGDYEEDDDGDGDGEEQEKREELDESIDEDAESFHDVTDQEEE